MIDKEELGKAMIQALENAGCNLEEYQSMVLSSDAIILRKAEVTGVQSPFSIYMVVPVKSSL